MATTFGNITFNNYKTAGVKLSAWPIILSGQQGPDADGGVINAADIDWGGAVITLPSGLGLGTSKTINYTWELLELVQSLATKISSGSTQPTTVSVTGVTVSPTSKTFTALNQTQQLTATVSPSSATNKSVTWTTGNGAVATVSNTGVVTAVGSGSTAITVRTADGGFTATCNVTVSIETPTTEAYYYYAGWTLPTVSNVDSIIAETYPTSSSDSTQHTAGKKTTSKSTFSLATVNLYNSSVKANYYVLVPAGHAIYDTVFGIQFGTDSFISQGTITVGNKIHTIYKSNDTTRNITSIEIK